MKANVVHSSNSRTGASTVPLSSKEVTATPFSLAEDKTQPCSPRVIDNEPTRPSLYVEANKSQLMEKVVMDQEKFDKRFGYRRINISLGRKMYYHFNKIRKWSRFEWLDFTRDCIPIMRWLPEYRREWICTDVFGGLMVSILSVPQGLAYGYLAGVPPIHGLYTSIFLSLIYVIFGSSKHAAPGAFAIISMMVGTVVEDVLSPPDMASHEITTGFCCSPKATGGNNSEEALDVVMSVTLLVGVWQIVFGLMNAGILAVWLSEYLVKGLMGGAAIHVVTSQLKSMTGLRNLPGTSEPFGLITFYSCFFKQIRHINHDVLIISIASIALLLISAYIFDPILKKWFASFKFPMELLLVIYGTLGMKLLENTRWTLSEKVPVVGEVTFGLYSPRVPSMTNVTKMLGHSISIAIISFAIHIALAKLIAKQMQYQVNSNQEWFALGAMHLFSSFFGCFAGGSSLGRSLMQVKFGTHSQISTLVAAIMLIIVVFGASKAIVTLPKAVLAAIVVIALKDLILTIFRSIRLIHLSVIDFLIYYVTFFAVIIVNVNYGLIIGISFALMTVVFRSQWPESTCVGRIPGTSDFKGFGQYRKVEEINGMRVFRFDAPIYFGNAELFLRALYQAVGVDPVEMHHDITNRELSKKSGASNEREMKGTDEEKLLLKEEEEVETMQLTHVIVDCSAIPYVDLMGKDAMVQASEEFAKVEITVFYSHCKVGVRQFLENTDFHKKVPKSRLFVKISDAVDQAVKEQTVEPESERRPHPFISEKKQPNTLKEEETQKDDPIPEVKSKQPSTAIPIPDAKTAIDKSFMKEEKKKLSSAVEKTAVDHSVGKPKRDSEGKPKKDSEGKPKKDSEGKPKKDSSTTPQKKKEKKDTKKKKEITVLVKKPEDPAPPVRKRNTKRSTAKVETGKTKKKNEPEKEKEKIETTAQSGKPSVLVEQDAELPTEATQPIRDK